MEFAHTSVLLRECIEHLCIRGDGIYVDGTLGGGGHASAICAELNPEGLLLGIDRDKDALSAAQERLSAYPCRKQFIKSNYADIKEVLRSAGISEIQGAILDLGVSSFQLDNPDRGFSYMQNASLDMRMDADSDFSAWEVVNRYGEKELTRVIREYGEERWASRIAKFIIAERRISPIEDTARLTETIKAAIPASARREGPHPAKRTFQAIRIEVNDELGGLARAVDAFCDVLADGGRLCIISFHSLEDRIVKETFARRANPCTCPKNLPCTCGKQADIWKITGKPVTPGSEELENNPRARSAKLRVIEKKREDT